MDEIRVIYVYYSRNVTPQLRDWADEVPSMPLFFVRIDQADTYNRPTGWGCSVALAEALCLDLKLRTRKIS
jgi:hypothetical protein